MTKSNIPDHPLSRVEHTKLLKKKKRRKKITVFSILGILLAGLLAFAGYEYYKINDTMNSVSTNHKITKKIKNAKPISVLLVGVDSGALGRNEKTYGVGNTDTLELLTINPKSEKVTMTSIPRDSLVKIDSAKGTTYAKINAAFSIGGIKQTEHAVEELLNVPIDYYAMVDMGVLEKLVDALGGVTVDNPFTFTYENHTFNKGTITLNGDLALKYSRMRHEDPDNDYGRQKRQQQIIQAIIGKLKTASTVTAVNKLLDIVKDGVQTNAPISQATILYNTYKPALNNVDQIHMRGENATIDESSVQVLNPNELNRVSKLVRSALELPEEKVNNDETKLYNQQTNYNQYTNVYFQLPYGYTLNVAQ